MYQYTWDPETGGLLLTSDTQKLSKEPRPVYYRELDVLGFDRHWTYPRSDRAPLLWAEANVYIYRGRAVARAKGGGIRAAPQIELLEPIDAPLVPVDVPAMVRKNREALEALTQETIQRVYNTYLAYKQKVDIFYVAFSGGKDSIVTLDIVQRALPHSAFISLFSDTGMEFADTLRAAEQVKQQCEAAGISFYVTRSQLSPEETWPLFGPPSTVSRWCCSVHKTVPQMLFLRSYLGKSHFTGMAFVGVRADESLTRSHYDYVSYGGKHQGQYSCNPILYWNSAEVFLYIYANDLVLNEAYLKGNRRAGCLVCPRAAERNDYMNHYWYHEQADTFVDFIRQAYAKNFPSSDALDHFIEVGGWKARKNGRDIAVDNPYTDSVDADKNVVIQVTDARTDYRMWLRTLGESAYEAPVWAINFAGTLHHFKVQEDQNTLRVRIDARTAHDYPSFVKALKSVFRKAACCVACQECETDCPHGYLHFENHDVVIDSRCVHCMKCHTPEKGCLRYKSLELPKGGWTMAGKSGSLNIYSHHAPRMEWIQQYFKYKNNFAQEHSLGSQMYDFFRRFLRDAELLDKDGFTPTACVIDRLGLESEAAWAIILTNICYAPQLGWYVNHVDFERSYSRELLRSMMEDAGAKKTWTQDIFSSLVRMSELPLGKLGVGRAIYNDKGRPDGLIRSAWKLPEPLPVLYSLYKFAVGCGGLYQFTLDSLADTDIERDGVSPMRIFGLDAQTMQSLLNGLAVNYPSYISASFTLDLNHITLCEDYSPADILQLF